MRYHFVVPQNSEEWDLLNRVLSIVTVITPLLAATLGLAQNLPPAV